jgi:hypothetical protein
MAEMWVGSFANGFRTPLGQWLERENPYEECRTHVGMLIQFSQPIGSFATRDRMAWW